MRLHDPDAGEPARARAPVPPEMPLTRLGEAVVLGPLGEGGRSKVFDAEWRGRRVALKVYKAHAVARHARKSSVPLARYEFERNAALHAVPGLERHVAEPLAYLEVGGISALVQERLFGTLYYFHHRDCDGRVDPDLARQLARIVELAHAAGLFDLDLHAMNVMVARDAGGSPIVRLFDFNLVPFHLRPRNPLSRLLLRWGLLTRRSRDLRMLRDFHDFSRIERRILARHAGAAGAGGPVHAPAPAVAPAEEGA